VKLYRRAKINLNLYRTKPGIRKVIPRPDVYAESLNPRAYELAACGAFHLSTDRPEVDEKFGDTVPIISGKAQDAKSDEAIIRKWLKLDEYRAELAAQLPACVAQDSWTNRAAQVLCDLKEWSAVTV
jgi:spore maturation protein CgeB